MARKTHYELLGVRPDASTQEITRAYRERVKQSHPDRFDPKTQREEWERANRILRSINDIYDTLCDPTKRKRYDDSIKPPPVIAITLEDAPEDIQKPRMGAILYADLPEALRARMEQRRTGARTPQARARMEGLVGRAFLLLLVAGFPAFLLYQSANDAPWGNGDETGSAIVTAIIGAVAGVISWPLWSWWRSPLKHYLYVTPVHLIETQHDRLRYWPLMRVHSVKATHHYVNAAYNGCRVEFQYDYSGTVTSLHIPSRAEAEHCLAALNRFRADLSGLLTPKQWQTLQDEEDDFRAIASSTESQKLPVEPKLIWCTVTILLAFMAYGAAHSHNLQLQRSGHIFAPVATSHAAPPVHTPAPIAERKMPQVALAAKPGPLPPHSVRKYYQSTQDISVPFTVVASRDGYHFLVRFSNWTTDKPVADIFIRSGMQAAIYLAPGTYRVKYTSGKEWYGVPGYPFGSQTGFNVAERQFILEEGYEYTVELYQRPNGNLHTTRIAPEQW